MEILPDILGEHVHRMKAVEKARGLQALTGAPEGDDSGLEMASLFTLSTAPILPSLRTGRRSLCPRPQHDSHIAYTNGFPLSPS